MAARRSRPTPALNRVTARMSPHDNVAPLARGKVAGVEEGQSSRRPFRPRRLGMRDARKRHQGTLEFWPHPVWSGWPPKNSPCSGSSLPRVVQVSGASIKGDQQSAPFIVLICPCTSWIALSTSPFELES